MDCRLNPTYDQAMNNLANIIKDQGEAEEAERLLTQAVSLRYVTITKLLWYVYYK